MQVFVTGASGFIGRHIVAALREGGHMVICAGRQNGGGEACHGSSRVDYVRDLRAADWLPRLRGIDAVINAVGILKEDRRQTFRSVHVDAPRALFEACVEAGVSRVVQISALGADEHAVSEYHVSKRRADLFLASLPVAWTIVQPSLVYGAGGTSARLFDAMATLPWIPVPGRGDQYIQPVHIDDVACGVVAALTNPAAVRRVIPFVGPDAISVREYLAILRGALGLGPARFISVPLPLVRAGAAAGRVSRRSILDPDTLGMLMRGNTGDPASLKTLLGRELRPAARFIDVSQRDPLSIAARLSWLLPLLRWSIAAVWIWTGTVSLGLYPIESSYGLLEQTGVPRALAPLFLYSAALLDLVLGFATLLPARHRWLWPAQIALILVYTAIISLRLPQFWLHPYAPIAKNLPMLAALYLLHKLERR